MIIVDGDGTPIKDKDGNPQVISMPFAPCWKLLLDIEIQKVIDQLKADLGIPVSIVSITNQSVAAATMLIAPDQTKNSPLKPKKTPCIFRIYVVLDTAGVFYVERYGPDKVVSAEAMNQGAALAANAGYMFDILVDQGEMIDFQCANASKVLKLSVVEKDDVK